VPAAVPAAAVAEAARPGVPASTVAPLQQWREEGGGGGGGGKAKDEGGL